MRTVRLAWLLAAALTLAGCSGVKVQDYAGTSPELDLFEYFAGSSRAWGMFQARSGELKRRFTVDIRGEVDGDRLTLTEDFVYDDGERQRRIWTIRRLDGDRYEGTAADVIGKASGAAAGAALNWQYTMRLPVGDTTYDVQFDDWMFLHRDGVLFNRAEVSKFGVRVGQVTLFFQRGDTEK